MLRFHRYTDNCLVFEISLMDAMRSTDVSASRANRSRTYHMLPVRLLVCYWFTYSYVPISFSCVLLYFTGMDCRLICAYCFILCLPFSTCRLVIPGLMTCVLLTPICTCISQSSIYTVGDEDSFLIFNLLCNHPTSVTCKIPRTLPHPF